MNPNFFYLSIYMELEVNESAMRSVLLLFNILQWHIKEIDMVKNKMSLDIDI